MSARGAFRESGQWFAISIMTCQLSTSAFSFDIVIKIDAAAFSEVPH